MKTSITLAFLALVAFVVAVPAPKEPLSSVLRRQGVDQVLGATPVGGLLNGVLGQGTGSLQVSTPEASTASNPGSRRRALPAVGELLTGATPVGGLLGGILGSGKGGLAVNTGDNGKPSDTPGPSAAPVVNPGVPGGEKAG